jgi:hypothetical protein
MRIRWRLYRHDDPFCAVERVCATFVACFCGLSRNRPSSDGQRRHLLLRLTLIGIARRNHSRFGLSASLLGLFLLALWLPSCGGGGSNGFGADPLQGAKTGTYTITVTGTSGTLSHQPSSAATLIVN